jgi:hypothetical protein
MATLAKLYNHLSTSSTKCVLFKKKTDCISMTIEYIDTIHLRDLHLHGDRVAKDPKHPGNMVNGAWEGETVAKIQPGDARTSSLPLHLVVEYNQLVVLSIGRQVAPKSPNSCAVDLLLPAAPSCPQINQLAAPSLCCSLNRLGLSLRSG